MIASYHKKQKKESLQSLSLSKSAQKWRHAINQASGYAEKSLSKKAALDSVERIIRSGKTENGHTLRDFIWFRQQIRLTADNRLKHVLTSGASQVSKSLVNYLVAIDELLNGQINLGWFYASRTSMYNQQPEQFQKMFWYFYENQAATISVSRDSTTRFSTGKATANFSYASSTSQDKSGGASEGKEQASFQASKLYLEEKSSWECTVDVTPRLGASVLPAKPIRELGTPGAGSGIESVLVDCKHEFVPSVVCKYCEHITWLHPKHAFLKPKKDEKTGKLKWFNSRGEILDFHSYDGTWQTAYLACIHCHSEILPEDIKECQLRSKATLQTADDFLDSLPENQVYELPVFIYLSPFLKLTEDPGRIRELAKEGLEPVNPKIYCQNKLGIPSELSVSGVSLEQYERILSLDAWDFNEILKNGTNKN